MYTIKEYHLRIVPPEPIYGEVLNFKKEFMDTFGKHKYSKSKPHITLVLFRMTMEHENSIAKSFDQLSNMEKFQLQINGFNIIESRANVLLLDIPTAESIKNIQTNARIIWMKDLNGEPSKLIVSKTPHITISTTKDKETLHSSFNLFNKREYHRSFEVDHLVLTSRFIGKTWDWEHCIPLSS